MGVAVDGLPIAGGPECPEEEESPSIVGPSNNGLIVEAGETISAFRVIMSDISGIGWVADSTDVSQIAQILGVSTSVATVGNNITLVTDGELTTPGFTWTMDKHIYFDSLGRLTQIPPSSGFSMIIGHPTSEESINVRFHQPIKLI